MSIFQNKRKKNYSSSNYIREYKIVSKIGEGSYAKIFKVQKDNSNIIYVLKQIPITEEDYKDPKNLEEILNESKILSSLHSNYILKYYDSFIYDNNLIIITEYCSNGDLCDYLMLHINKDKKLTEKLIWKIFIQISLGLYYLHNQKILHRDIKTKNIFLKENFAVKIGDLGIAKILNNTNSFATTFIGTPYYLSPELCKDLPYNDKSDVWALGCVLYEMCNLRHPFEGKKQIEIYRKIINENFPPVDSCYSSELRGMIDLILQKSEKLRPKMKDIVSMDIFIKKAKEFDIDINFLQNGNNKRNKNNNYKSSLYESNYNRYLSKNVKTNNINTNNSNNKISSNLNNNINYNNNSNKEFKNYLKNSQEKIVEMMNKKTKNYSNEKNNNKNEKNELLNKDKIGLIEQKNYRAKSGNISKRINLINKGNSNLIKEKNSNILINTNNEYKYYFNNNNNGKNSIVCEANSMPNFSNELKFHVSKKSNYNSNNIKNIHSDKIKVNMHNIIKKIKCESNSSLSQKNLINENNIYLSENNLNINSKIINHVSKTQSQEKVFLNNNKINKKENDKNINNMNIKTISINDETISENKYNFNNNNNKKLQNIKININLNHSKKNSQNSSKNKNIKNLNINKDEFTLIENTDNFNHKHNNSNISENIPIETVKILDNNDSFINKSETLIKSENSKIISLKSKSNKKLEEYEYEMKNINDELFNKVMEIYKNMGSENDNKNIEIMFLNIDKCLKLNIENEEDYKKFKKSFCNYVYYEIEIKNIETQIKKRNVFGKWK